MNRIELWTDCYASIKDFGDVNTWCFCGDIYMLAFSLTRERVLA